MSNCFPLKLLDGAIPVHLKIDADPAVERMRRHIDVEVGNTHLDDLRYHIARVLIVRDADFD
jgi:hypothetical protein